MSKPECESCLRLCYFLKSIGKIVFYGILILLSVILISECYLRKAGFLPADLAKGLSATVPDHWTDWAMRPNVNTGSVYTVTNSYGMHDPREFALEKNKKILRVAVLGSSVVWGLGLNLKDTIPSAVEAQLKKKQCHAEVMNFGAIGFNYANISSFMQTKLHQFNPDIVILVTDLQVLYPKYPNPHPAVVEEGAIKKLTFQEALLKRLSQYSALFALLDDKASTRQFLETKFKIPVVDQQEANAWTPPNTLMKSDFSKASQAQISEYEKKRKKEMTAIVAAVSSFYRELGIPLYFVTPYGPYFHHTEKALSGYSLDMLAEAKPIYGSLSVALQHQAELGSTVILSEAPKNGARVINMLERTKKLDDSHEDFSGDGIHLTAIGNQHLSEMIANHLINDGYCMR